MAVLFALAMFLGFALLDWLISRGKAPAMAPDTVPTPAARAAGFIYGFHLPANRSYHSGHGWALRERKNVVRIGIDASATRLTGKIDSLELPKPGQWIHAPGRCCATTAMRCTG